MPTKRKTGGDRLTVPIEAEVIERRIYVVRGFKVMVDSDLGRTLWGRDPRANPSHQAELESFSSGFYVSAFTGGGRGYAITNCDRIQTQFSVPPVCLHGTWRVDAVLGAEEPACGQDGHLHRANVREAGEVLSENKGLARAFEELRHQQQREGKQLRRVFVVLGRLLEPASTPVKRRFGFK